MVHRFVNQTIRSVLMRHWRVFKKLAREYLMLLTHGSLVDKRKLFVDVIPMKICKFRFSKKKKTIFL